jgi:hypothetical protein
MAATMCKSEETGVQAIRKLRRVSVSPKWSFRERLIDGGIIPAHSQLAALILYFKSSVVKYFDPSQGGVFFSNYLNSTTTSK